MAQAESQKVTGQTNGGRHPDMQDSDKIKSIGHALGILNEAAKDSSQEIRRMINQDYKRIKETLTEVRPAVNSALQEIGRASVDSLQNARDRLTQSAVDAATKVDKEVRKSPWYFMGGAALIAIIFGFMLGKKK